jgi:hypothetical protein
MTAIRYQAILWHIANLERATTDAAAILNRLPLPNTEPERAYLSQQLDIVRQHVSTSSRIAQHLACDLPQIMEAAYD